MIRHAGAQSAAVIGHDWGGSIAWQVALRHRERVDGLAALAAPHPAAFQHLTWPQARRSCYVFFFQLPWAPEAALRRRGFARLLRAFRDDPVHPEAFTDADIAEYRRALAQPGALTAALNCYGAALRRGRPDAAGVRPVEAPTLVLWGDRDRYLGAELLDGRTRWDDRVRVVRIADASHWLRNDVPERVNTVVLEFLREPR